MRTYEVEVAIGYADGTWEKLYPKIKAESRVHAMKLIEFDVKDDLDSMLRAYTFVKAIRAWIPEDYAPTEGS